MKLTVNLGENSYPIYIENGILTKAGSYISKLFTGKRIMVISDDHVFPTVRTAAARFIKRIMNAIPLSCPTANRQRASRHCPGSMRRSLTPG